MTQANHTIGRRDALKEIGAGTAAALSAPRMGFAAATRPNLVYIHSHDTGRYVQPYGHSVHTPNLAKLASQGVLFRHAFNAAPTCSPSRASLLTGQCPHRNGMFGLAHRGFSLQDYKRHIAHTLRPAGYHTQLVGLQHIARQPATIGYDGVVECKGNHVETVAPAAVEFLNHAPQQPFFLDVGFFETHREFRTPGPGDDWRYVLPPATVPDTAETRRDMAAFHASARLLDSGIGEVMRALEASGLAGNTLVICTTDHGISFPAMKCNLTDHGMGVMLMMRGPGGFSGGKVVDAMVSHLDLFPTICDLLEIERPRWLEGASMLPLLDGREQEIRQELFAEVNYHAAYEPMRAVRTRRWKYIRRFDGRKYPVLPNCDDGLSKKLWLEHGWRERPVESEALYDLVFDPNETRNMAAEASLAEVRGDVRGRLSRWMQRTDDPLLAGPVAAPPGALANDPSGISPKEPPLPVRP